MMNLMKPSLVAVLLLSLLSMPLFAAATTLPLQFVTPPSLEANPNPAAPLAAVLRFKANQAVHTRIEILNAQSPDQIFNVQDYDEAHSPEQGLVVLGFHAGTQHRIRVSIRNAQGMTLNAPQHLEFAAPALPSEAEAFPLIDVKRFANAPMESGMTIFNPRRRIAAKKVRKAWGAEKVQAFNQNFGLLTVVDTAGNVVWYYAGDARISDFELLRNGHLLYLTHDSRVVEIDWLGNIQHQWYAQHRLQGAVDGAAPVDALTLHHDIDELPNGHFLVLSSEQRNIKDYYTSSLNADAPRQDQTVMGDVVLEFDRNGTVVWRWNAFEHLDVYRVGYGLFNGYWTMRGFSALDWTHANGIMPLDDGNVLVNFCFQNTVGKIDKTSGELLWLAGDPSGWKPGLQAKLMTMQGDEDDWFWFQHAPMITPQSTLLVFDNANIKTRPFNPPVPPAQNSSRVMEYALDESARTIKKIWSSEIPGDPAVVSYSMGSTQVLPDTGNILAGYGFLLDSASLAQQEWTNISLSNAWTRVREYTHDTPAQVVWELTLSAPKNDLGLGWSLFGTKRIKHLGQ